MKLPPGFQVAGPEKVRTLWKSLVGLKQEPRCWFTKLSTALEDYPFKHPYSGDSLFNL